MPRPAELGLLVDGHKYRIELTHDGVNVDDQHVGRSYLRLNVADFTRLVLGQLDWEKAINDGRLVPSTMLAHQIGHALFPQLPLWRPPFDDLMA